MRTNPLDRACPGWTCQKVLVGKPWTGRNEDHKGQKGTLKEKLTKPIIHGQIVPTLSYPTQHFLDPKSQLSLPTTPPDWEVDDMKGVLGKTHIPTGLKRILIFP